MSQDHFSQVSDAYAAFRPTYPDALFDWLASITPARSLAWDCAAGSGQATVPLAGRFDRVLATDLSAAQLTGAPRLVNVDYRAAPAEDSRLADGSADLVTVAQALHWFDLDRFYAEVARVLKPGGVLVAWNYGVLTIAGDEVDRMAQRFYHDTVGPYWPPERRHVESGYRVLPFPFAEIAAPSFAMEADWTLDQLLGYFRSWSATGHCTKATGRNPVDVLAPRLAAVWGDASVPRRVTWPVAIRVGKRPTSVLLRFARMF